MGEVDQGMPAGRPFTELVLIAGVPAGVLFFEGGEGLRCVISVAGGREAEDFPFGGGEGADEFAEDRVFALVGVMAETLPVVVGAAEAETPGVALAVGAQIVAGGVHGVIGEDAEGAGFADERLGFAHIVAMFFGGSIAAVPGLHRLLRGGARKRAGRRRGLSRRAAAASCCHCRDAARRRPSRYRRL